MHCPLGYNTRIQRDPVVTRQTAEAFRRGLGKSEPDFQREENSLKVAES